MAMEFMSFKQWLQEEKGMSIRSANDVISRCRRISKMTQTDNINDNTISLMLKNDCYENLSSYIKSQLKRAANLYIEFTNSEVQRP